MQYSLNLPNLNIIATNEFSTQYIFEVEALYRPNICQRCGKMTKMVAYGNFKRRIVDLPMHGKQSLIHLMSKRYKCLACNKTFLENIPDIDEKRSMTKRLIKYIAKKGLEKPFTSLVQEIGNITLNTVKAVCVDYMNSLEKNNPLIITPEIIGINEIHLLSSNRTVITNITQQTLVDILENTNLETIEIFLNNLANKQNVKYITIDMLVPYKIVANKILPHAKIIIDKSHVITYANQTIDKFIQELTSLTSLKKNKRILASSRNLIKKRFKKLSNKEIEKLGTIFQQFPIIKQVHLIKEQIFDIYEMQSKTQAIQHYNKLIKVIENLEIAPFKEFIKTINYWHPEIFNYFDNKITNVFTENLNSIIRFSHQQGRGYSFKILRGKILFLYGNHAKIENISTSTADANKYIIHDILPQHTNNLKPKMSYGIELSTLNDILGNIIQ